MPNWVYNHISVAGKKADLLAFAEKAAKRHTELWLSSEWVGEKGDRVKVDRENRTIEEQLSRESVLSFWNFITPADEELPYYYGHKVKPGEEDDPDATPDERMAKALTFSGSDAYDWNVREWGTKWDASQSDLDQDLDTLNDDDVLTYRCETAWSIPTPVFTAMIKQHPELQFDFESEEEQGWGAEFTSETNEAGERVLTMTEEWDIPDSHADFTKRGQECFRCEVNGDDEENWYDDCPRPEQDYYVVVTKTYRVSATNAENAWNLANDNDPAEMMEHLSDEDNVFVKDGNGQRAYPVLNDKKENSNLDLTIE
jgi:hypothetical protein